MRVAALVLLLATVTARAQWVSPTEQVYGPYTPSALGSQPALAASGHGVLLAWSEIDPADKLTYIHTGLLDFNARLITPITKLPQFAAKGIAWAPNVATDGEGFFVAWNEPVGAPLFAAIALDRNAMPLGAARFVGKANSTTAKPIAGWNGSAYFSGIDSFPVTFDRTGTPGSVLPFVPAGFRYSASGALFGATSLSNRAERRCTWGFGWRCVDFPAQLQVKWTLQHGASTLVDSFTAPYYAQSVLAAGDEHDTALLWRGETNPADTIRGVRLVDGSFNIGSFNIGSFDTTFVVSTSPFAVPVPEAVAFDGERWLLVMTSNGDVSGAFIDREGATFTTFPITTGARIESRAQVLALAPGRFLVAYDSDLPGDHRIAGRIVTNGAPPKRRAIH
ncbi:MAG TPA: hypothetical protein VHW00_11330 [Thermoanaerobaculia bacterium]|nr:hypothetical protein [Thermoanaerobaculia bacterium]